VAAHREGVSRPIRVGVGDEIRELCPGDQCTFEIAEEGIRVERV
jgi:hypothetical protein